MGLHLLQLYMEPPVSVFWWIFQTCKDGISIFGRNFYRPKLDNQIAHLFPLSMNFENRWKLTRKERKKDLNEDQ